MRLVLDESKPIFLQIAAWLEDAIISGQFAEGEQIPSITEFSVQYKINPATALKGVSLLADAGLLYKRRGLGMFVAGGARAAIISRRSQDFYRDFILPLLKEAERVQLSGEQLISMIERGMNEHGD